jgi:putative membrane protein
MIRTTTLAALMAAGLMLAPATLRAQDNATRDTAQQGQGQDQGQRQGQRQREINYDEMTDAQMLQTAAYSGLMEVATSKEAESRAGKDDANANIEKFAKRMQEDHGKANKDLVKLAESKSIDLKQTLPERMKQQFDRMHAIEDDNEFLRQYLTQQVRAHQRSVKLFTAMSEHADDADVRAFGEKYLPALKEHLEMVEELAGVDEDSESPGR